MTAPRPSKKSDEAALSRIWHEAFGDDETFIRSFLSRFHGEGSATVACVDGEAVSMAFLLPDADVSLPSGETLRSPYLYAMATLTEHRGLGLGAAVCRETVRRGLGEGADLICLMPAEEWLYDWYDTVAGFVPVSFAREARFSASELPEPSLPVSPLTAAEYALTRERLLEGFPHAVFSERLLALHEGMYGRMYAVGGGCAIADPQGGELFIRELLLPSGDTLSAVAALTRELPAESAVARTPVFWPGPGNIRPFVAACGPALPSLREEKSLWWGPVLD